MKWNSKRFGHTMVSIGSKRRVKGLPRPQATMIKIGITNRAICIQLPTATDMTENRIISTPALRPERSRRTKIKFALGSYNRRSGMLRRVADDWNDNKCYPLFGYI